MIKVLPAQPTAEETKEHQEDRTLEAETNRAMVEANRSLVYFTKAIAVFTAALVGVGLLQGAIYRGMHHTARVVERAYISVGELSAANLTHDTEPTLTCVITNSGRTPARMTSIELAVVPFKAGQQLPDEPKYRMNVVNIVFVAGQRSPWTFNFPDDKSSIPALLTERTNNKSWRLAVLVRLHYIDKFKETHFTNYGIFNDPEVEFSAGPQAFRYILDSRFNDAD